MTQLKWLLPFPKRIRARRLTRRRDDPSAVFKTFVLVLERMQAHARASCHAPINASEEKS